MESFNWALPEGLALLQKEHIALSASLKIVKSLFQAARPFFKTCFYWITVYRNLYFFCFTFRWTNCHGISPFNNVNTLLILKRIAVEFKILISFLEIILYGTPPAYQLLKQAKNIILKRFFDSTLNKLWLIQKHVSRKQKRFNYNYNGLVKILWHTLTFRWAFVSLRSTKKPTSNQHINCLKLCWITTN